MTLQLTIASFAFILLFGFSSGDGGGHHRKVIIHVPYKVKHIHHTHTIIKHIKEHPKIEYHHPHHVEEDHHHHEPLPAVSGEFIGKAESHESYHAAPEEHGSYGGGEDHSHLSIPEESHSHGGGLGGYQSLDTGHSGGDLGGGYQEAESYSGGWKASSGVYGGSGEGHQSLDSYGAPVGGDAGGYEQLKGDYTSFGSSGGGGGGEEGHSGYD